MGNRFYCEQEQAAFILNSEKSMSRRQYSGLRSLPSFLISATLLQLYISAFMENKLASSFSRSRTGVKEEKTIMPEEIKVISLVGVLSLRNFQRGKSSEFQH
jgi:hypothetical protein